MEEKASAKKTKQTGKSREDRLKQALKANLARRKAQTRARDASGVDSGANTGTGKDKG